MNRTDGAYSIGNGSTGPIYEAPVQPAIQDFTSTATGDRELSSAIKTPPAETPSTLAWKLENANDVTIASRRCVETLVAHRIKSTAKQSGLAVQADEPRRFTLDQLYLHPKVSVELYLLNSADIAKRERLQTYAKQLQALDQEAIPAFLDAFVLQTPFGPGFAIVQVANEAKSVQAWIEDGYCFDEFELMLIALRVLSTLKYLHGETKEARGCTIHQAIKPSNILLEDRRVADPFADYDSARDRRNKDRRDRGFGRLYLLNLGKAPVESASGVLTTSGTYGYTAPEQFYGQPRPASDLYSLGATLIYLASGKSPTTWMQPDLKIVPGSIALSRSFVEWISRLTHADLAMRTASTSVALQELELIQLVGKPLANGDYEIAKPRRSLSLEPQTFYLDFKVNSTPQELRICFNYDRITGDKKRPQYSANRFISPEELKTALLLVVAVIIIGGTVGLTGSPFLGFVVALLLPAFYFIMVPPEPVIEPVGRQANIRLRRDACGRMFITLATTPVAPPQNHRQNRKPLASAKHNRRRAAQRTFQESQIHFANVPIRLLCPKPGWFTPKISFIMATNDPKRTEKISITGSQEEIRWLRVHVGRWLKS